MFDFRERKGEEKERNINTGDLLVQGLTLSH